MEGERVNPIYKAEVYVQGNTKKTRLKLKLETKTRNGSIKQLTPVE